MELKQVKGILHQSECGEMFLDGMGCSEPVLTKTERGLIDNFFVYLVNKKEALYSGPIARMGLQADSGTAVYIISCDEEPLSVLPTETIKAASHIIPQREYEKYSALYGKMRSFAFKTPCSDSERQVLSAYMNSLKNIVNKALFPFYKEIAPSFFTWANNELR